jgi:hypothetical protein
MLFGALIDLVVDLAEKLLVMRSSIGEVHTLGSARAPGRTIQHLLRVPYPRAAFALKECGVAAS